MVSFEKFHLIILTLLILQDQLRRRREEEERIAQQNEFLRASLRGSRKLKALQDHSNKSLLQQQQQQAQQQQSQIANELVSNVLGGVENEAFLEDEVELDKIVGKNQLLVKNKFMTLSN